VWLVEGARLDRCRFSPDWLYARGVDDYAGILAQLKALIGDPRDYSAEELAGIISEALAGIPDGLVVQVLNSMGDGQMELPSSPLAQAQILDPKYRERPHLVYLNERMMQAVRDVENGQNRLMKVSMPPRSGKQVADHTPVPTPDGWTTHGQLRPGDRVFHPDGYPIRVVWRSEATPSTLRVTLSDGSQIDTHPNHEWTVYDRGRGAWRTVETRYLCTQKLHSGAVGRRGGRYRFQLPEREALQYPERDLPIDPYSFGVWLGDGKSSDSTICHAAEDYYPVAYPTTSSWVRKDTGVVYRHLGGGFRAGLRQLGVLGNKHIPDEYLTASVAQRRALLAGLIDTDGHHDKDGRVHFSNTNLALFAGAVQLIRSLGYRVGVTSSPPHMSSFGITGRKDCFVASFSPHDVAPARLLRKQGPVVAKRRRVAIVSIEPLSPEQVTLGHCIEVDSADGLYLVGEHLTPTHNSSYVSEHFPAWILRKHPDWKIGMVSYADPLAVSWGRAVRRLIEAHPEMGIKLAPDLAMAAEWQTTERGGVISRGINSGYTGVGFKCVHGDTIVESERGPIRIEDAYRDGIRRVLAYDHGSGRAVWRVVEVVSRTRRSGLVVVTTAAGRRLVCTAEHLVAVGGGYRCAADLRRGDPLVAAGPLPSHRWWRRRGVPHTFADPVSSVDPLAGGEWMYDLQVAGVHNFFADGLLVHNCLIIDDPVKGTAEAHSKAYRDAQWERWTSDLFSRLESPYLVCVLATRWHEDDLLGRLGNPEFTKNVDAWESITLPALAESADVLGRDVGDPLFSPLLEETREEAIARWEEVRETVGTYHFCTPAESPVLMADWTTKPISEVNVGDVVMGYQKGSLEARMSFVPSVVQETSVRVAAVQTMRMASGNIVRCTSQHRWYTGRNPETLEIDHRRGRSKEYSRPMYAPAKVGRSLFRFAPDLPPLTPERQRLLDYIAGVIDGEGHIRYNVITIAQSPDANPDVFDKIKQVLDALGWDYQENVRAQGAAHPNWGRYGDFRIRGCREVIHELLERTDLGKRDRAVRAAWGNPHKPTRYRDKVTSIEPGAEEPVYALQTETGNYVVWGYASSNSALYQQHPAPSKGAIFDISSFRYWTTDPDKLVRDEEGRVVDESIVLLDPDADLAGARWLDSWDCAFKGEATSDWVVGQRWARLGPNRYLVAQKRGKWTFTQTLAQMEEWAKPDDPALSPFGHRVHQRLIEDKANGPAIIDVLHKKMSGIKAMPANVSKESRARAITPEVESGHVYLPHPGDPGNEWVLEAIDELRDFPHAKHDDVLDALVHALTELRDVGVGTVTVPQRKPGPAAARRLAAAELTARRSGVTGRLSKGPRVPGR